MVSSVIPARPRSWSLVAVRVASLDALAKQPAAETPEGFNRLTGLPFSE